MSDSKQRLTKRQSTQTKKTSKPAKPYPEFPLFPHATRRWAKKIRGKLHYFGSWGKVVNGKVILLPDNGWKEALSLYKEQIDDLQAGKTPRPKLDGLTLRDLVNKYLTSKQHRLDSGELSPRTFADYHQVCERLLKFFGAHRLVEDLRTEDFAAYRAELSKTRKAVSLGNVITRTKMVFKFGYEEGVIDKPIRYGQSFAKPSKKTLRLERQQNGKRMFEREELKLIIDSASQPLRAMILLGINCGFGQSDIARLPKDAFDNKSGWVDFPRPKTGVKRRCKLWQETVEALQDAIATRPEAKNEADEELCFLTRTGRLWVRLNPNGKGTADDSVCKEYSKLLKKLELKRHGVNFYALRHTFETIAGESLDQVAVNHIMGHIDNSMASHYRERISDERLQAVTDHVRNWLFNTTPDKTT